MSDYAGAATQGATALAFGARAVVVSGTNGQQVSNHVDVFDSATQAWSRLGDFPGTGRADASGFLCGGKGYLAFGWGTGSALLKEVWAFDPVAGTWERRADFPGEPCILPAVLPIGARVYLVGGGAGSLRQRDVWTYDPAADTWTRKGDFPGEAVMTAAAFVLDGRGYIATGTLAGDGFAPTRAVWAFDPASDAWTRKADFPGAARGFALAFSLGGRDHLGLGIQSAAVPMTAPLDLWAV